MKNALFVLFLFSSFVSSAQKEAVQQSIITFFEGFHAKDSTKMKSVCAEKMVLKSIQENSDGAKLEDETVSAFYKSIASIPDQVVFKEKILSYAIQVDGTLAQVWTPYEFYINGVLSHKGVNAFTLFKEDGPDAFGWKIIYCIDTRRK